MKPSASSKSSPKRDVTTLLARAGNTMSGDGDTVIRTALKKGISELRDSQVTSYTLAAELLLLHVLGRDRAWMYAHPEQEISAFDAQRYFSLIAHRAGGEPTQHLTGKQEFWSLEFEVTPDVLIPRPETEHVIEVALDRLAVREIRAGRRQSLSGEGLQIADIGTGSGCIAVALAKELPEAAVLATDISPAALEIARRNAVRHSVSHRIQFMESNLFANVVTAGARYNVPPRSPASRPDVHNPQVRSEESRFFDLVASNPPYVGRREAASLMREVRDHEPEIALYGGEEGHELYADLISQAAAHLKPGGILVLELGHNTLRAVQPLLDASTWIDIGITNDLAGIPRVIATERA